MADDSKKGGGGGGSTGVRSKWSLGFKGEARCGVLELKLRFGLEVRRVRLAGGPRDGVGAEPHWEVSPAGSSRHTQWQLREKVPMQTGWFSEGKRPKHAWIRRAPVQQGFAVHPCSRALQSVGRPPHIAPTREKVNENDYWLQWLNIKGA